MICWVLQNMLYDQHYTAAMQGALQRDRLSLQLVLHGGLQTTNATFTFFIWLAMQTQLRNRHLKHSTGIFNNCQLVHATLPKLCQKTPPPHDNILALVLSKLAVVRCRHTSTVSLIPQNVRSSSNPFTLPRIPDTLISVPTAEVGLWRSSDCAAQSHCTHCAQLRACGMMLGLGQIIYLAKTVS